MAALERHGTLTRSRRAGVTEAAEKKRHASKSDGRWRDNFRAAGRGRSSFANMWRATSRAIRRARAEQKKRKPDHSWGAALILGVRRHVLRLMIAMCGTRWDSSNSMHAQGPPSGHFCARPRLDTPEAYARSCLAPAGCDSPAVSTPGRFPNFCNDFTWSCPVLGSCGLGRPCLLCSALLCSALRSALFLRCCPLPPALPFSSLSRQLATCSS
jgi:hypothetical protein